MGTLFLSVNQTKFLLWVFEFNQTSELIGFAKVSALQYSHPLWGHQMQVGWVKIGDFRQITGYISKTVKDRDIVFIKVE